MIYDIKQIQEKLSEVISTFKKAEPNYAKIWQKTISKGLGLPEHNHEQKLPEYFPGYCMTVDYMERIKIHAEHGLFPEKMFLKRAPNQTQQEFDYIRANYKNVTFPFFMDYISTVTRAFSDPNCGVDFKEENPEDKKEIDTFRQYVESEIPQYGSIEEFMQGIIPTLKAIDANGVIAVKPNEIRMLIHTDEVTGEETMEVDTTERINPAPFYFSSRQVVGFQEGDFCMVELNEKSEVNYGNQKLKIGKIYEFYDDKNIWKITQVGDFVDYEFNIQIWYEHGWQKMPVTRLKGIPRIHCDELIWLSPLIFVTDILDLVTMNSQYLQGSMATACYPYRVMYGDLCEFQGQDGERLVKCMDGYLYDGAGTPINKTCSMCHGTGLKSRISPFGVMLLKPPTRDSENEGKLTGKPMEWISPEVTTLEFLLKKIGLDYQKARHILHLDYNTNTVNPGNSEDVSKETATQAASGQKALYAFVKSVSDQTFDIYQFILDAIGWMRYGGSYQRAVVKYPTTFDFLNTMDYIGQIGFAVNQKVPSIILYQLIYNYLQSVYNDDKDTASAFKLIVETDRLLTLTQSEIQVKQGTGNVEKWEEILHTSAPFFVQELIKTFNPTCKAEAGECIDTFFTQDLETQKKQLINLAKARANDIQAAQPKPQETLIRDITQKQPVNNAA